MFFHLLLLHTFLIALCATARDNSLQARDFSSHGLRRVNMRATGAPQILRRSDCFDPSPTNTITDRMNKALNSSGAGYILSLCPNTEYQTTSPILFAFPNQEISTAGYPTDNSRAVITVSGSTAMNGGHTTAVDGTCDKCDGVILRNIQINGTRDGAPPINGGANIEMGGSNSNQLIEFVHSHDPRGWSCLHIAQGNEDCNNVTVRNNDIGPCGSDLYGQWADGISFACQNGVVKSNLINNPTDGGIVLFGAPGTLVENNTIWVETNTLLGGINLVDVSPFGGNYTGVVVQKNAIVGGFATDSQSSGNDQNGTNSNDVIVKIGIAIGPRIWFGAHYLNNVSSSGFVLDNTLSGAFGYGIAMSGVKNFTVNGNSLEGATTFVDSPGPNCTDKNNTPKPAPFVYSSTYVQSSTLQSQFQNISDGDTLTCIEPPSSNGDYWPYGGNPSSGADSFTPPVSVPEPNAEESSSSSSSAGRTAGIIIGVLAGFGAIGVASWYIRKRCLARSNTPQNDLGMKGYVKSTEHFEK